MQQLRAKRSAMAALSKFLALLVMFLLTSLGDAFMNHAQLNYLIRFDAPMSTPMYEPVRDPTKEPTNERMKSNDRTNEPIRDPTYELTNERMKSNDRTNEQIRDPTNPHCNQTET
jgi:hypothetical protein